MGFFSWNTSDTKTSISNRWSTRPTFPVYMITEDGQIFEEKDYDGYGVFGGKDIFVLISEMNGYKGKDDEESRDNVFKHIWKRGIMKGDKKYYHSWYGEKGTFRKYDEPIESEGGICANDLVSEHGWKSFGDSGEFSEWAEQGYKVPKLVENIPMMIKSDEKWKSFWDSLPYPEDCLDQGFFYGDDYDDFENE